MVCNSDNDDSQLTIGSDYRITKSGVFLRKYKIDEFAQFINVLKGDMSVVGPRPEIPQYVALYPSAIREIVSSVRPGITDRASIEFRNESEILGESSNPEEVYVEQVLPIKISYYVDYVEKNSFFGDLKIILSTLKVIFVR
jgi:lipopolysaccharide/colanic/teichoic acid biosynthesis glycosyltransferase